MRPGISPTLEHVGLDFVSDGLETRTPIGHPPLEVWRDDGSSLSLSTDGERAFLVRIDVDGTSHSSAGEAADGPVLVFDYRGSCPRQAARTRCPCTWAVAALTHFVEHGRAAPDLGYRHLPCVHFGWSGRLVRTL